MNFINKISKSYITPSYKLVYKELPDIKEKIQKFNIQKLETKELNIKHCFCEVLKMIFCKNFYFDNDDNTIYSILEKLFENPYYNNIFLNLILTYNKKKSSSSYYIEIILDKNKNDKIQKFIQEIFFISHFCYYYNIKPNDINNWFLDNFRFNFEKLYHYLNDYFLKHNKNDYYDKFFIDDYDETDNKETTENKEINDDDYDENNEYIDEYEENNDYEEENNDYDDEYEEENDYTTYDYYEDMGLDYYHFFPPKEI